MEQDPPVSSGSASTREHRLSVLLVDDDIDALAAFSLYLRMSGVDVVTAGGGKQALQMTDTFAPDVIVVDMSMPSFSGLDLIDALKSRRETAAIPTILFSGRPLRKGLADACLSKPCLPSELLAVVRTLGRR